MDLKIFAKTVDEKALQQINTLASIDAFKESKIRIMPDVHAGAGCVIGFTADLGDKVIPNIVGVDIGCGMRTTRIMDKHIDFDRLDNVIRKYVPSGMNVHSIKTADLRSDYKLFCMEHLKNIDWLEASLGTLGGGNHFIEVDVDDLGNAYLVIHTGSRNLGKQVCEYYQNYAISKLVGKDHLNEEIKKMISEYKEQGREAEIEKAIATLKKQAKLFDIPNDLCYLEGMGRWDYLYDMRVCQKFAIRNREMIEEIIFDHMGWERGESFETIHNYIDHESNIVRKGAISAKKGERVLIPMNMRDGCIIGIGKGNEDWNCSAPHGAGRIMSRAQARNNIGMSDFAEAMNGIYTTSVCKETIDEAPQVYKPMQEIVDCIADTVSIEKIIHPIYNFKAAEK